MTKQDYLLAQGEATLNLEGMSLTKEQGDIALQYISGEISRDVLIREALSYARSN